jgi:multimeric flavodoxin WrbA
MRPISWPRELSYHHAVRSFLFVLSSTRPYGNSEVLARRAASRLVGAQQRWLRLGDYPLPPFADTRHSTGYASPEDNERVLVDATLGATDLVIVTPVNWYSVSWLAKLYLDHWSAWLRIPELNFAETLAGRTLWSIIVDSDTEGEGAADPVVDVMRRTAEYMKMQWHGALVGHANRPGEIEQDGAALSAAESYFTEASP